MSEQFGEVVPAPLRRLAMINRRSTVESVFRPSKEGPRGSAGPGPSHHAPSRRRWRSGVVEPPTGVLRCSASWWETGPGCMQPRSRAREERVRRTLVLNPVRGSPSGEMRRYGAAVGRAGAGACARRLHQTTGRLFLRIVVGRIVAGRILVGTVRCKTVPSWTRVGQRRRLLTGDGDVGAAGGRLHPSLGEADAAASHQHAQSKAGRHGKEG